jgi:hypothetical protein
MGCHFNSSKLPNYQFDQSGCLGLVEIWLQSKSLAAFVQLGGNFPTSVVARTYFPTWW